DFDAVLERLCDGVHAAAKCGQQRRMRVDDAANEGIQELGSEDFVEACEHYELDPGVLEGLEESLLTFGAFRLVCPIGNAHGDMCRPGTCDGGRVAPVAADNDDPRRKFGVARGVEQSLEIGASA